MTFLTTITKFLTLSGGEKVFWRESGHANSSTILLLHGFPASSHQFRNLIPLLAPKYRVIAPDLPGFGFTEVPSTYNYTFANLADTIDAFLKEIPNPPEKYSVYIFDYGAPTGLRLALKHPEKIQSIVSQNGNAYVEGFGEFWDSVKKLWANNSAENREALQGLFTYNTTKSQYTTGTKDPDSIAPESYTLDQALLERPGQDKIQLDLFYDYRTNVDLYPKFQEYFRKSQVPLLAAWGKNDIIFIPPGAEAFKRDLPKAEVLLLDGGHFLEETNTAEIAELILGFLKRNGL
ncbi:putative hydrolase [Lophiostoma macrostomum CBS 122681]|uniref:Putative hydrolase n=1 Tax=Lophiostoma macrostomum CBS 122681 TaxID=1314788 RepID=A0A6A6ST26_9PLEO|nr:putative hydrolase [Lophiostoma macrostomum CBS 122681]